MKKLLSPILTAAFVACLSSFSFSQTAGTLSFSFTQLSHTSYSGTKNVLAVWIQSSTGTFIKTRMRNVGNGTKDHLPTWAVNSGGTSGNAMGSGCNVVSATTGATLTSFSTRTVTWDGTDVNGNVVADGTYKVTIEETWNHGGSGSATRSFTFTKGASDDIQSPTADANFSNISLAWVASAAGIEEGAFAESGVKVYPNPSKDGYFNVDYTQANSILVFDVLGVQVSEEKLAQENGSVTLDLSNLRNGIYFLQVSDGIRMSEHKVIISK